MNSRKKIFFIAASPNSLPMLKSENEYKKIRPIVERTSLKLSHDIQKVSYATADDIVDILTEDNPWMIHYSGHGEEEEGDWTTGIDSLFYINNDNLIELIKDRGTIKFMFLNSCHSHYMAAKVCTVVDFVIGFQGKLNDDLAVKFAEKFYLNWSKNATIPEAFNTSKIQMGVTKENKFKPVFHAKINVIMKSFKILMEKHQTLEAARIEYEKQEKITDEVWEKLKGCEESIKSLARASAISC